MAAQRSCNLLPAVHCVMFSLISQTPARIDKGSVVLVYPSAYCDRSCCTQRAAVAAHQLCGSGQETIVQISEPKQIVQYSVQHAASALRCWPALHWTAVVSSPACTFRGISLQNGGLLPGKCGCHVVKRILIRYNLRLSFAAAG